jgi:hypothetical protein
MLIRGMLGLGDNLHQRAVVRQLMQQQPVWLQTPWASVYHDLVGPRLNLLPRDSRLRTQQKNIARERGKFNGKRYPGGRSHRVWYTHSQIKQRGGFLAAMCHNSGVAKGDFSLPVPAAWQARARALVSSARKPLMIYRPLVDRTEWDGCRQRNPDSAAYAVLAQAVREQFFVVSIADLVPRVEWMVSEPVDADMEFHAGELDFETIAGLMSIAGLAFCSPGFALVLAQAVGAPLVAVFGGHESARLYDHGSATDCFIQPKNPCECFSKRHACDKRIEIEAAQARIEQFIRGRA